MSCCSPSSRYSSAAARRFSPQMGKRSHLSWYPLPKQAPALRSADMRGHVSSQDRSFPISLIIIAGLMIVFGLAEVVTGFTHQFFGLTTSQADWATTLGVALGLFYFVGGILVLTKWKWAAIIAIVLLCGDVIGRIGMVIYGLYPLNSFRQTFGIVVG